eukprot:472100-Rhodomonas_salina.4
MAPPMPSDMMSSKMHRDTVAEAPTTASAPPLVVDEAVAKCTLVNSTEAPSVTSAEQPDELQCTFEKELPWTDTVVSDPMTLSTGPAEDDDDDPSKWRCLRVRSVHPFWAAQRSARSAPSTSELLLVIDVVYGSTTTLAEWTVAPEKGTEEGNMTDW